MTAIPDQCADLPPSAKLVVAILAAADDELTQARLAARSQLPERTVRWALERLRDRDLVAERPCPQDARQSLYRLSLER